MCSTIEPVASAPRGTRVTLLGGGFGTQAKAEPEVHPTIVWAKFDAMAKGAKLATDKLW